MDGVYITCIKCSLKHPESHFKYIKIKYKDICKVCKDRISKKNYKINNKEKIKSSELYIAGERRRNKKYTINNRHKVLQTKKNFYKNKIINNPSFAVENSLRTRLYNLLKRKNIIKTEKTKELLGCSYEEFKIYIENLFKPGMSWNNYGVYGWHIDHIIPCSYFDLTKKEDRLQCFSYKNLQPLWAEENLKKGNKHKGEIYGY